MTATLLITNFSRSIIQTYSQIPTSTHINIRFDCRFEQNVPKAESLKKEGNKKSWMEAEIFCFHLKISILLNNLILSTTNIRLDKI